MSIKVMSWVWENGPDRASERLLLLSIADFCDDNGVCWPSMKSIAEKSCMTERGAQKIIRRLAEEGWLSIETGGGRGGCNVYKLHCRRPNNPEPQTPNPVHPEQHTPIAGAETPNGDAETPNRGSPEPSGTVKEPRKSKDAQVRDLLVPILGDELTDDWIGHRKAIRKPMTPQAGKQLARSLGEMRDPAAAVRKSIESGWAGVFPQNDPPSSRKGQGYGQRLDDAFADLEARLAVQPFGRRPV